MPDRRIRLGIVILPEDRWAVMQERWIAAEEYGFDHAWTYDHLAWRMFRDEPWFGAIPTLTAAAMVTKRIQLGTLVASPNFRHPVPFAKELMSLDDIARGRLIAGIGAGGDGWDATVLGQEKWSTSERADRFDEFVRLLDRLLRDPRTTHSGRFYSAEEARMFPGCAQEPRLPLAIAAAGPRGMRLAAEFADTWVTTDDRGTGQQEMTRLNEICEEVARPVASLQRLILIGFNHHPLRSFDEFENVAGTCQETGFTDLVLHWPRDAEPFSGHRAVLERIAADYAAPPSD